MQSVINEQRYVHGAVLRSVVSGMSMKRECDIDLRSGQPQCRDVRLLSCGKRYSGNTKTVPEKLAYAWFFCGLLDLPDSWANFVMKLHKVYIQCSPKCVDTFCKSGVPVGYSVHTVVICESSVRWLTSNHSYQLPWRAWLTEVSQARSLFLLSMTAISYTNDETFAHICSIDCIYVGGCLANEALHPGVWCHSARLLSSWGRLRLLLSGFRTEHKDSPVYRMLDSGGLFLVERVCRHLHVHG